MLDFLPAFDSPRMERMERKAQKDATRGGIYRRLSFALLTKSSVELRAVVAKPGMAEKFLYEAECLGEAIERLEAQIDLMRKAKARILAALSDTVPEAVEEGQPKAEARDEALRVAVISEERGLLPTRFTPAYSIQDWMQVYESLSPGQVDAVLAFFGSTDE